MIWSWPGTPESWLVLIVTLAVGMWPVMIKAGMVWGRMQCEDEHERSRSTRSGE